MKAVIKNNGKITITFVKGADAPDSDEETLVYWLFKVFRQFGLEAEIETDTNSYTEDELTREL